MSTCAFLTVCSVFVDSTLYLMHYYEGSDFCLLLPQQADLPAYLALPSDHSISKHALSSDHRFIRHVNVVSVFQASPWIRRLATTKYRIEFVILRTDLSPPVAPHPTLQ
jgi:hypothetical protein